MDVFVSISIILIFIFYLAWPGCICICNFYIFIFVFGLTGVYLYTDTCAFVCICICIWHNLGVSPTSPCTMPAPSPCQRWQQILEAKFLKFLPNIALKRFSKNIKTSSGEKLHGTGSLNRLNKALWFGPVYPQNY